MAKPRQEKKEINGVVYTAQFNGLRAGIVATRETRDSQFPRMTDQEKLCDYVLKNVIVSPPGLTIDSFETHEELNAVVNWGTAVLYDRFRNGEYVGARKSEAEGESTGGSKK